MRPHIPLASDCREGVGTSWRCSKKTEPTPPPTKGKRTALDQKVHSQAFKTSQQIGCSGLLLNAAGLIGSRGGVGAEGLTLV